MKAGVHLLPLSVVLALPGAVQAAALAPRPGSALPVGGTPVPALSLGHAAPAAALLTPRLFAPAPAPALNAALPKPVLPAAAVPAALPAVSAAQPAAPAEAATPLAGALSAGLQAGMAPTALFDGAAQYASAIGPQRRSAPGLYTWFRIADAAHGERLAEILEAAEGSAQGRATLNRLKRMLRSRKRPLVFEFTPQRNTHAYVDWDTDVVRLGNAMLTEDPVRSAPILVHELTHVLQRARRLPYSAFEYELEAWLVTLKVARDLGLEFKRSDFQGQVQRRFAGGLDAFIVWLHEAHDQKENLRLLISSRKDFLDRLEARRAQLARALARAEGKVARYTATYEQMRAAGYKDAELESYRRQELVPAQAKMREAYEKVQMVDRDLKLLRDPNGYARYRRYADGVMAMARRLHASWAP